MRYELSREGYNLVVQGLDALLGKTQRARRDARRALSLTSARSAPWSRKIKDLGSRKIKDLERKESRIRSLRERLGGMSRL